MLLEEYNYHLPESSIAQSPAIPRDSCKLLVLEKSGKVSHKIFKNIIDLFNSGDVLVLNNTKVKKSKLIGKKITGSSAEIILLEKFSDSNNSLNKSYKNLYKAKIKTKNPHVGTIITLKNGTIKIVEQKNVDTFIVSLSSKNILDDAILPTPPYIKRILDDDEYQTVFSKSSRDNGSLAAPTAGLHFTPKLLKDIEKKGVKIVYITLHVSYGTFKNIDDLKTYIMDPEEFDISKLAASTINNRHSTSKLIVCGTTTLKALETSSKEGKIISGKGKSELFIYPPFKFNSGTDALITNFHLPKSTLLLLTCAFGKRDKILKAYHQAVDRKYKFYSLGDAMIIFR